MVFNMKFFTVVFLCLLSGDLLAGRSADVKIQTVGVESLDMNDSALAPLVIPVSAVLGEDFASIDVSPRPTWMDAECPGTAGLIIVGLDSGVGKAMLATALTAKANGLSVEVRSKIVAADIGGTELPYCVVTFLTIN